MADKWGDPTGSTKDQNPYVDWWWYQIEDGRRELFEPRSVNQKDWFPWFKPLSDISKGVAKEEFSGGAAVPIPRHAASNIKIKDLPDWYRDACPAPPPDDALKPLLADLPDDLVIVGIIDTGIALGHRRFQLKDGTTRFLAAWQQTSAWNPAQTDLPFGQELYFDRINELLADHTLPDGRLDEDAFNRAACLIEPHQELGHRDLEYRAAHGTHVLDLATGFDPDSTDGDILNKYRIIAVNLPPQYVHGTAGNFLVFFAVFALERILCLADALWRMKHPGTRGGYPVVVNFSFGMQAGTKDGNGQWERLIAKMIKRRRRFTKAPTRLVMPVGNDNLERCAAFELMGDGEWKPGKKPFALKPRVSLPWRICPSDQTSNFVEICALALGSKPSPTWQDFQLFITLPSQSRPLQVPKLQPGQHSDLGGYARIYSPLSGAKYPLRLVICVAPTLRHDPKPVAPAGEWTITVEYKGIDKAPVDVAFYVQSDQAPTRHGSTDEQSYFDHPGYKTHRENGALRDSFDYRPGKLEDLEPWAIQGPVQRKGSQNALATSLGITVVGGYRLSDGCPALYSATTSGARWRKKARRVIDGLYPTEDGAGYFGLLAAGARDGSTLGFRGTSMAAAQATRDIAEQLGQCGPNTGRLDSGCGSSGWLRQKAHDYESSCPAYYYNVPGLKGGPGHLPMPDSLVKGRLPRFGSR